jgi:hypothetical protein
MIIRTSESARDFSRAGVTATVCQWHSGTSTAAALDRDVQVQLDSESESDSESASGSLSGRVRAST